MLTFTHFFVLHLQTTLVVNRYKLFVEQSTHNVRYYFFRWRVFNVWNYLSSDTDFPFLAKFKAALNVLICRSF